MLGPGTKAKHTPAPRKRKQSLVPPYRHHLLQLFSFAADQCDREKNLALPQDPQAVGNPSCNSWECSTLSLTRRHPHTHACWFLMLPSTFLHDMISPSSVSLPHTHHGSTHQRNPQELLQNQSSPVLDSSPDFNSPRVYPYAKLVAVMSSDNRFFKPTL